MKRYLKVVSGKVSKVYPSSTIIDGTIEKKDSTFRTLDLLVERRSRSFVNFKTIMWTYSDTSREAPVLRWRRNVIKVFIPG